MIGKDKRHLVRERIKNIFANPERFSGKVLATVESLRKSEERYRYLYKNTPAMLHSIDRDGNLVIVSNDWLEITEGSR